MCFYDAIFEAYNVIEKNTKKEGIEESKSTIESFKSNYEIFTEFFDRPCRCFRRSQAKASDRREGIVQKVRLDLGHHDLHTLL